MTTQTRDRVERTRQYLLTSGLTEDTKDGLGTLLDAAASAANGTEDRMGVLFASILLERR